MATAAQKKRATEVEERLKSQKAAPGQTGPVLQMVVVASETEWKDLKAHLGLLDDSLLPAILQRLKLGSETLLTEAKV